MFTGLIEAVCEIKAVAAGASLTVDLGPLVEDCRLGDSIAVNGVCLTVTRLAGSLATFGLSAETLAKSTLSGLRARSKVNIERAMKATDRFGGHFVQGHVDGIATITAIQRLGEFADWQFGASASLLAPMVEKGSVAIDGISLTIAELGAESFRVAAIPETLARTTLGAARIGDRVNIEIDIVVKAIRRQLEQILPGKEPLTMERLKQMGF